MLHPPVRTCFVCSGNICRSPTAQVVFDRQARESDMAHLVEVDSAGTGAWHEGQDMDARSRRTMVHAGYDVPAHSAKQFGAADFASRDVVIALDTGHYNALWWLAAQTNDVERSRAKIVMLRAFDPQLGVDETPDVADPYYDVRDGFTEVLKQVERSCAALLEAIGSALERSTELAVPPAGQQLDRPPL